MKRHILGYMVALGCAMGANAAVIEVSPGTDTLQTAIQSSAPGDVLVLEEGIYSWSGDAAKPFTIFHDLTIRGENSATKPTIDVIDLNGIKVMSFSGLDTEVVFQNIKFTSERKDKVNPVVGIPPLESFTAVDCDFSVAFDFQQTSPIPNRTKYIHIIGGYASTQLNNTWNRKWELRASNQIVIAGMTFSNTPIDVWAGGNGFYFVGNEYSTYGWRDLIDGSIRLKKGNHNIVGNNFNQDYSIVKQTSSSYLDGADAAPIIGAYSLSTINVSNNTFSLGQNKLGNLGSPESSVAIYVNDDSASLNITNNVFHHETINTTTNSKRPTIDVKSGVKDTRLTFAVTTPP